MRERGRKKQILKLLHCLLLGDYRLPVTALGRGVALVRVTDPPIAMVMEDEGEGRMGADSTEISPPAIVKLVSLALS